MKRVLLTMIGALLVASSSFSQGVEQGNIIIDPYYGFPNFGKSLTEQLSEGISEVNISGYGPAGLRVEYMVGERFGIGVDAIFNGFSVEGTSTDSTFNATTGTYDVTSNSVKTKASRVRVHARFNYHFDISSPDLDVYIGFGAGTNNRFYKYYENGSETEDASTTITLLPVSFRFASGMRYYFTDNIGLNAEIGLGGPVVSAGLSIKI
ncbi:MAG: porin family protein [Crocinitomicaceae bacterium]|nr:porin family protein [Crocinitomicaceae bacterium]